MKFLITAVTSGATLLVAASLFSGISVTGAWAALIAGVVLGILNALVRPILLFLTFPINLVTLGLFTFVINALILWLASGLVAGVTIVGFWSAFFIALLISVITSLVDSTLED